MEPDIRSVVVFYVLFVGLSLLLNAARGALDVSGVVLALVLGVGVAWFWRWAMGRFARSRAG